MISNQDEDDERLYDKNDITNEISEIPVGKKNGDGKGVECV